MIKIEGAQKSFGKYVVFENLELTIDEGTVFGLVGINGAGKSTLLRSISGIYALDKGRILIDGEEVYENPRAKAKIFFVPDEPYTTLSITGERLKNTYKAYYSSFDEKIFYDVLSMFELSSKKRISTFSKGMKRRLFIALAFAIQPKILLLDEAFDGLDPFARLQLKEKLIDLVEKNKMTVIISSHSLRELEDICDRYAILDNKRFISNGNIGEDLNRYRKYQLAFEREHKKEDFAKFNPLTISISGRVVTMIVPVGKEELEKEIKEMNPILIDDLPLNFEDFFISNVKGEN